MNILVVNDDGIKSKGLWALAESMSRIGNTLIVAPDKEQSGVGSSISIHNNINITEIESTIPKTRAYAVEGTPSDCVKLGTKRLSEGDIDLVVSGINPGPNIGSDIYHSGTVMATLQSHYFNIPSMAVSIYTKTRAIGFNFDFAAQFAAKLAAKIDNGSLKTDAILNVNVPNIPTQQIKGILTTITADTGYVKVSQISGHNPVNYCLETSNLYNEDLKEGTDIWAIHSGYISITPLQFSNTRHDLIPTVAENMKNVESELFETDLDIVR